MTLVSSRGRRNAVLLATTLTVVVCQAAVGYPSVRRLCLSARLGEAVSHLNTTDPLIPSGVWSTGSCRQLCCQGNG